MTALRALLILLLASPALAEDLATGDTIRAALVGNTVEGSMSASGGFAEYYSADGAIKAADYSGVWSFDGDRMCFAYGEDPAACWAARISGDRVIWLGDGGEEGSGTIRKGNPNGF